MSERRSLAELRAKPERKRRVEATETIYLRSEAAVEYDALNNELIEAVAEWQTEEDKREAGKPSRLAAKGQATLRKKIDALSERLDELAEQMKSDTQIDVGLAPITAGEWNRWKAANPAREEGEDGQRRIIRRDFASGGRFDFDALVEELPRFVLELNGEEPEPGDWRKIVVPDATPADLDKVATAVMNLHESSVDLPKSRRELLATLMSKPASK